MNKGQLREYLIEKKYDLEVVVDGMMAHIESNPTVNLLRLRINGVDAYKSKVIADTIKNNPN